MRNWRGANPTRRVNVAAFSERERVAYPFVQHLVLGLQKEGVRLARFGTVALGQRADLMPLPGNPLEDVGQADHALGVMVRGQGLPREQLLRMREKATEAFPKR